jgi:uncharacterized protein YdcH (DUF465 family)
MQKYQHSPSDGLPSPTLPPPPNETQSNQKFNFRNPYKLETPLADMSAVPRAETISSSITPGSDWAGMNGYGNPGRTASPYSPSLPFNRGDLVTPPQSSSTNGPPYGNANGGYHPEPPPMGLGVDGRRRPSDAQSLGPSPPMSIANSRSSDGTLSDQRSRKYRRMEAELLQHYAVLKAYLRGGAPQPPRPNKARDKLLRLSPVQFHELSTDVFDELQRRQASAQSPAGQPPARTVPQYLLPRSDFHEKRNQARQKLSSLQDVRFRDLSTDVFCELERRFPHFQRMDRGGRASPAPSSQPRVGGSNPPAQNGYGSMQPRSQSRGPPPAGGGGGYGPNGQGYPPRNGSISGNGVPRFDNPPLHSDSDYGRPMPKQFQSNTIMPNKSVMVEDEDEYGGAGDQDRRSDAFGLDGIAASLPSNRDTSATSRSAGSSGRDAKLLEAAQAHAAELQGRVNALETSLKTKEEEIRRLEEETKSSMSSEWVDVKQDLERRLEDAEKLNQSMKEELERVHMDQVNVERDLRSQLDNAKRSQPGDSTWKTKHDRLERDYQDLQIKLKEQRKVTEEVKQQASGFLTEMRAMADGGGGNLEREERLQSNVLRLEEEVKEWKARYARTKTQLRNMRASSLGLSIQRTDASRFAKDDGFTRPDGLVKDVHITKFQIAIDELLHIARTAEPSAVLDYMKAVVVAVRSITQDIITSSPDTKDDETSRRRAKLKSYVSATANNVITASKNFATSNGISPVSLLDAAASHLTAAIVELVRTVKIRPTPAGELEDDDDGSLEPLQSPGYFSIDHSMRRISGNDSVYSAVSSPPSNTGRQHGTDRKQSLSRPGGSFSSGVLGNGLRQEPSQRAHSEIEELKVS